MTEDNPPQVQVKICGITNHTDAFACAKAGADMLGFNFYQPSPRFIAVASAREIAGVLPREIKRVGVFVNSSISEASDIVEAVELDAVQLHGDETPDFCCRLRAELPATCTLVKAFRTNTNFRISDVEEFDVDAVLVDAYSVQHANLYGGSGETCDWMQARAVRNINARLWLAGGLTPANVVEAIRRVQPAVVDACSGVEHAPGAKSATHINRFIAAVRRQRACG